MATEAREFTVNYGVEEATLRWEATSTTNLLGWLVEKKPVNGSWVKFPELSAGSRELIVKPLAPGPVAFRVWAVVKQSAKEAKGIVVPAPIGKPIIGINGSVGWGPSDAKLLYEAGFRAVRIEDGTGESVQTAIADGFDPAQMTVIVGNIDNDTPLSSVNVSQWVASTIEQIKAVSALGVRSVEIGNEMYAKAQAYDAKTYAEMCMSLYDAIGSAGLDVQAGVSCINDMPSSTATGGGGWLRALIAAQPGLAARADYWITHPYPADSGLITDTGWMGNCGPQAVRTQIQIAESLGVKNNAWALTEFGVQESGPAYAKGVEHQAAMIKEYVTAFLEIPQVRSLYYFSVHDSEGTFGLVTTPNPAGPLPWEPRPALAVLALFV